MTSIYDRYNEREIAAYREGEQEARRFRANHGDIYQELFKAETDDYQIHVGYDDVEMGTYISVTFKRRLDKDGCCKNVMFSCGGARKAIVRAVRFIAQHPVEEPYCNVDY